MCCFRNGKKNGASLRFASYPIALQVSSSVLAISQPVNLAINAICRCVTVVTPFSKGELQPVQGCGNTMSKWHNLLCSLSVSAVTEHMSIKRSNWLPLSQRCLYHKCMRWGEKRREQGGGGDICGPILSSCSHHTWIDELFLRLLYASC